MADVDAIIKPSVSALAQLQRSVPATEGAQPHWLLQIYVYKLICEIENRVLK
jgi:hypothetical protein